MEKGTGRGGCLAPGHCAGGGGGGGGEPKSKGSGSDSLASNCAGGLGKGRGRAGVGLSSSVCGLVRERVGRQAERHAPFTRVPSFRKGKQR